MYFELTDSCLIVSGEVMVVTTGVKKLIYIQQLSIDEVPSTSRTCKTIHKSSTSVLLCVSLRAQIVLRGVVALC